MRCRELAQSTRPARIAGNASWSRASPDASQYAPTESAFFSRAPRVQDCDLGQFDVGQILAIAFLKLLDRVATLLDHFVENAEHRRIIQFDALVDLDLLDGSQDQAYDFQPVFFAGLHGGLHVLGDAGF
jgi:hypothetical protein